MTDKEKESAWLELKRKKAEKKQIDDYYKDIFFWVSIIPIILTMIALMETFQ
jgi:hypothetical protein